jgi:DNA-binding response OmpR family regulator
VLAEQRTILVAEDHAPLLALLTAVLLGDGYEVLSAANGERAIACCDGRQIDVMLIDLSISGTSGVILVEQLRECLPTTLMLTMSGSSGPAPIPNRTGHFLQKPFRSRVLLARLAELTGPSASG